MGQFDDIRPFNDDEVLPTLERLIHDPELLHSLLCVWLPRAAPYVSWLLRPILSWVLKSQLKGIKTIQDLQYKKIIKYMGSMVKNTTTAVTYSGVENLQAEQSYLFVSNHRDIAMDPAFVNWSLYENGRDTVRIAIGDNLLTKPFVSDAMRLNKSFIVKRGLTRGRDKLMAAKELACYIRFSLQEEKQSVWIAQREGRAKDGLDKTQPAVLKMMSLGKDKGQDFGEYMSKLYIVPVAISYEWDACDAAKARELYMKAEDGGYVKDEHEDVASIAAGISGAKGHVHIAFGKPVLRPHVDADLLAATIDRKIWCNYHLMPTNYYAYQKREGSLPEGVNEAEVQAVGSAFEQRLAEIPEAHRDIVLQMYANPVYVQQTALEE